MGIAITQVESEWIDYSAGSTVIGWGAVTKSIRYQKLHKTIRVTFDIDGASNANSASFTLPVAAGTSATPFNVVVFSKDAGSGLFSTQALISGTTVGFLHGLTSLTTWSTTGNKVVRGEFFYEID